VRLNACGAGHQPLRDDLQRGERALEDVLVGSMAINASMFKLIEIALES